MREIHVLVAREEATRLFVQRPQMRLPHAPGAAKLFDDQLRIGSDTDATGTERRGRLETGDERPILSNVVRRDADALADRRETARRCRGRVVHDGPDCGGAGVPAGSAVAEDDDLGELAFSTEQRRLAHGTRIAPQLSQYATTVPAARRIRSASVDGIDR